MQRQVLADEVALNELLGCGADCDRIRFRNTLDPERNVRRLPQRQMFLADTLTDLAHHHQPRMYADAYRETNTFFLLQTALEPSHGIENAQSGVDGPLRVILMRLRPAEVYHQAIAEVLGNVGVVAFNDLGAGGLIGADDISQVLRIELAGKPGGVGKVAKHHGELAAFGVRGG
jgi:hypothetical protein